MDPRAFDELSRQLGEKTSRRKVLKLFGGALVGTLVGADVARANPPEKHCKFEGYGCGDNTDCCSQLCCNRTCCGTGQVCSGGMCTGGTSPPPPPPPPPPGGCTTAADCPSAAMGSCKVAVCTAGTCGFMEDDMNLPACSECQVPTCNMGQPLCTNKPAGTPCSSGVCNGAGGCGCPAPTVDCNGVCVDTNTNVANCGACGHACNTPNGVPGCVNGQCVVVSCIAGFADCDQNAANGCETNVFSDVTNCGACGNVCRCMSGAPVCSGGICQCV
jgi:hypothetical protein